MSTSPLTQAFLNGAIMVACLTIGLFFARSYRDTRDRFFKLFSAAFVLLGIERMALALSGGISEAHPGIYLVRCIAFLVIIYAVIDKNKS